MTWFGVCGGRRPCRLLQGQPLVDRAKSLGVSLANLPYQGVYGPGSAVWESKNTPEIQRRVMETERHFHDMNASRCVMLVAAAAAAASTLSAAAAGWAVFRRRH